VSPNTKNQGESQAILPTYISPVQLDSTSSHFISLLQLSTSSHILESSSPLTPSKKKLEHSHRLYPLLYQLWFINHPRLPTTTSSSLALDVQTVHHGATTAPGRCSWANWSQITYCPSQKPFGAYPFDEHVLYAWK